MKKTIYAIILNYNNARDTIECIDSFFSIKEFNMQLIIVDNASEEKYVDEIEEHISGIDNIELIVNRVNLGYAGGNNVGIRHAVAQGAEYIAIVNNDVIVNKDSFTECVKILDTDESVAFVGPTILEYGSDLIQYTGGTINFNKLTSPHINSKMEYRKQDRRISCDYVGGACMMFKKGIIDEIGYIPEVYFLFWEETEWCYKAKQIGKKCICTLNGSIAHKGSSSVKKIKGLEAYYLERNRVLFSIRNDHDKFRRSRSIFILCLKAFVKGFIRDRVYFGYLVYYFDGIRNKDRFRSRDM